MSFNQSINLLLPPPLLLSKIRCSVGNNPPSTRMGCTSSISKKIYNVGRKKKLIIPEVVVFVPTMRIPVELDFHKALKGLAPRDLIDRLSALRSQIVLLAEHTDASAFSELQQALEQYLPVVLGLTKKEHGLEEMVEFRWKSLQDRKQLEVCVASSAFELLSVVHMMAMLLMSEANTLLAPKDPMDASERNVSEECKKDAIDLLIKVSGYLQFCVRHILGGLPPSIKTKLPWDFEEGFLVAISIQVLGQGTEMQLGLAVESQKASLSVKRRLACEQLSYFAQAHYCLSGCNMAQNHTKKHSLFLKWKYLEAKAVAYYYHGLILDKGTEPSSHISAVCCFLAANELLVHSKKACLTFCVASPVTRSPPLWGVMKHLHHKIPDIASKKSQMYGYLIEQEKVLHSLPDLPDFELSLRPEDYNLPEMDPAWDGEKWEIEVHTLKEHLKDGEDGTETE